MRISRKLVAGLVVGAALSCGVFGVSSAAAFGTKDQILDQSFVEGKGVFAVTGTFNLSTGPNSLAQTFTAGRTGVLTELDLYLSKIRSPPPMTVDIETTTNGQPSGTILASGTIQPPPSDRFIWVPTRWDPATGAHLIAGTQYAIVLSDPGDLSNFIYSGYGLSQDYTGGNALIGDIAYPGGWLPQIGALADFRTYADISKAQCLDNGWQTFGGAFTSQAACISYMAAAR